MYKRVVKNLWIALLCTAMQIGCFGGGYRVSAASKAAKAVAAYKKVLSGSSIAWGDGTVSLEGSEFGLLYVDKDNTPELAVLSPLNSHAEGYYCLYRYQNGKVVQIRRMMDTLAYYPKKNIVETIHSGTGGYQYFYFLISGKKAEEYLYKLSEEESGWDVNGDGKISIVYRYKSKNISKKKFNALLKKKTKGAKLKEIKWHKNTSQNRKKYL